MASLLYAILLALGLAGSLSHNLGLLDWSPNFEVMALVVWMVAIWFATINSSFRVNAFFYFVALCVFLNGNFHGIVGVDKLGLYHQSYIFWWLAFYLCFAAGAIYGFLEELREKREEQEAKAKRAHNGVTA